MSISRFVNYKNWPISFQIIGLSVAITATCVTALTIMATRNITQSVEVSSGEKLSSVLLEREQRLSDKISTIKTDLHVMASDHATVLNMITFDEGFDKIAEELTEAGVASAADTSSMDSYLRSVFGQRLKENGLSDRGVSAYTPKDENAKAAQRMYIADNSNPVGSKHDLDRSGEEISYNEAHGEYHDHYRTFVDNFGLYDLFMIDPDGNIVYSVFKEADYATNIVNGPYAGTGLYSVFNKAKGMPKGEVALVDFSNYEPSYGAPAWFCASPLYEHGEVVGVLAIQIPTDYINEIIGGQFGETGQSFILGDDRKLRSIVPNDPEAVIFSESVSSPATDLAFAGNSDPTFSVNASGGNVLTVSRPVDLGAFTWQLVGTIDKSEVLIPARAVMKSNVINGFIIAIVMIPIGFFFARSISRPVTELVNVFGQISNGDMTARTSIERGDEIGHLAGSVNTMAEDLSDVLRSVQMSSNEVASAATEISASTEQVTAGMSEQRMQTSQVSAAIEQMSSSVREVAESSNEVAHKSEEAGNLARDGGSVVEQTVEGMGAISDQVNLSVDAVNKLGELSERIGSIVSVINDIADQTNLLALNAAIEAARAGEHGRGFAVVADEVRKLAERTMDATGEVAQSVEAIQEGTQSAVSFMESGKHKVDDGMDHAQSAGNALRNIVTSTSSITPMIESIAAAANEQAAAANEISDNVLRIESVTNQSADAVNEVNNATSLLSEKSESLLEIVQKFKFS